MITKLFLDSGDPKETKEALALLGKLDGQTTNPSLIAKNPDAVGKKFSNEEIYSFYEKVVKEISNQIPNGSVSIEVYADSATLAEAMVEQGLKFYSWIPNAHIKLPTTAEGLKAASMLTKQGIRVNMTLVFSQAQAAAIYAATKGAKKGDVFVSPFVGRLDDRQENGMDLIKNILEMYKTGDGHVEVLSASIRSLEHFAKTIELGCDLITAPLKAYKEWIEAGSPERGQGEGENLKPITYEEISLDKSWQEYNIVHELTDKGLAKFAADWNNLIK
ncbi:MAG: transaldolase family protein [Candidatus Doudnabacteria bacterium]|jgi:transaldolase